MHNLFKLALNPLKLAERYASFVFTDELGELRADLDDSDALCESLRKKASADAKKAEAKEADLRAELKKLTTDRDRLSGLLDKAEAELKPIREAAAEQARKKAEADYAKKKADREERIRAARDEHEKLLASPYRDWLKSTFNGATGHIDHLLTAVPDEVSSIKQLDEFISGAPPASAPGSSKLHLLRQFITFPRFTEPL